MAERTTQTQRSETPAAAPAPKKPTYFVDPVFELEPFPFGD